MVRIPQSFNLEINLNYEKQENFCEKLPDF